MVQMTKKEFERWLKSDDYKPLVCENENGIYVCIKVPKNNDFDYLYMQSDYHGITIHRNRNFEYNGIYCKKDGLIYDSNRVFHEAFPRIADVKSKKEMETALNNTVCRAVESIIADDRSKLTVSEITSKENTVDYENYRDYHIHGDARGKFLLGDTSEDIRFRCLYEFGEWDEDNLLEYILDPDAFAGKEVARYINEHQEDMLEQFMKDDLLRATLKAYEDDTDNPIHRIRAIIEAVDATSAKTVNVTIQKDDAAFTFKTDASVLRRDPHGYYGTWYMAAPDRNRFESQFGRNAHYYPEDITKITYGRNTVYEAEPPENAEGMTVEDFIRSHPTATLDLMTPGGYVVITPEKAQMLLGGDDIAGNLGSSDSIVSISAEEVLSQTICQFNRDDTIPNKFNMLTDSPEETEDQGMTM